MCKKKKQVANMPRKVLQKKETELEDDFEKSEAEKREERTRYLWQRLRDHVKVMKLNLQFISTYDTSVIFNLDHNKRQI